MSSESSKSRTSYATQRFGIFKERLRAARDAYAEAIAFLNVKAQATSAIRPSLSSIK